MAKIGNLQVGTIKINYASVTGVVQSNGSEITVPNNYGNPVILFWSFDATLKGPTSNRDGDPPITLFVKKGSTTIYTAHQDTPGFLDTVSVSWGGSYLDVSPSTPQTYSMTPTNKGLMAMYVKK